MLSRTLVFRGLERFRGFREPTSSRRFSDEGAKDLEGKDEKQSKVAMDEEARVAEMLKGAANFNESTDTTWSTTPYPSGAPSIPAENAQPERVKMDPTNTSVILFPGQGTLKVNAVSQYLKFPRVKDLYENANEILGYDLLKLSLHGPQERLNRTEFNQPATVVASLAALERLWEERPSAIDSCRAVAGYSVGEITALIFSGAIGVEDGIRLAAVRGAAMQKASELSPQGMISVFCSASANISVACKDATKWALDLGIQYPVCKIAVYFYTQGKIIAGNEEALHYLTTNADKLGIRHVRRLPVSGAFHTILMEPALKPFMKALGTVALEEPRIDVYANTNARIYNTTRDIKRLLPKQIVSTVMWEQIMQKLYSRPPDTPFPRTFDLGSNGTMKTILKRVNLKACDHCYSL